MQQSPQQPTMPMYQQQQQAQIDASDVFKSVNKLRHVVDPSLMQHAINWPTIHLEKEVCEVFLVTHSSNIIIDFFSNLPGIMH